MLALVFAVSVYFGNALGGYLPPGIQFSGTTLSQVQSNLNVSATHSWEIGTRQTALFELNAPDAFVYGGAIPPTIGTGDNVSAIWQSIDSVLAQKPPGILPFFSDGAAGDPASVGIPVLIRNATQKQPNVNLSLDAAEQLDYLVNVVPRTSDGAISQRSPPQAVQLWADNLSMAPPFIAYYGALSHNKSLVDLAYNQIRLYRQYLLDSSSLLEHIVLGDTSDQDHGHWSTGNGWALSGMLRVLRIIQLSSFASEMSQEQANIISWASDLTAAIWKLQQPDGSLLNYLDQTPNATFHESSGTALIAAATFRLATITRANPTKWHDVNIPAAERAREYIVGQVDSNGWLKGVVDPFNWFAAAGPGVHSPEGQAFVLMLHSAYRDWRAATGGNY